MTLPKEIIGVIMMIPMIILIVKNWDDVWSFIKEVLFPLAVWILFIFGLILLFS